MRYGSLKLEPGVAREAAQPGIRELQLSLRGTVYNGKVATLQFVFGAADTVLCSKRGKCQKDVARSLLNPLLCGLSLTNFHFAFFFCFHICIPRLRRCKHEMRHALRQEILKTHA